MRSVEAEKDERIAVRFEDVCFSYGDVAVLSDARFHIHRGQFAALVGANGAGKTTVLRLILGLARPSSGTVTVLGRPPEGAREGIGYVPQHASYDPAFPISVMEVVRMGRLAGARRRFDAADKEAVERAMAKADVADLAARPYAALSGGQRRRVLVARALASEPDLLILDEPTANMDAESEGRLFDALGAVKGKSTVLIVTHDSLFVSSLTDAVFCVGDPDVRGEPGVGRNVVKHAAAPAAHLPGGLYGGTALQVLHDTEVSDDDCCAEEKNR